MDFLLENTSVWEKKIERTKDVYYQVLQESSKNWHEDSNDNTPFTKYLLGTILAAYRDFEDRLSLIDEKLLSSEMVEKACKGRIGKFTKSDIMEECPSIGKSSVENALKALVEQGKIERLGSGKATFYVRKTI